MKSLFSIWSRASGRKLPWDAVVISVLAHIILLVGAAYLTVMVIQGRQKMMFDGKKSPSIPAHKLEHSIRVKQMQKQVRKPQILQRLVSQAPSKVALPEMPKMQSPDIKNLRDTPLMSARAGSTLGSVGGVGGGAGRGLTGGTGYSDTKFFGENVRTRAICILMDISPSMVAKGVVEDVRKETMTMMESLSPVTLFNIIIFVDGADSFTPQMVYATQDNKTKALEWLKQTFNSMRQGNRRGFSGSTPSEAIRMATEMGCDTMFILSDDPPYLKEGDMYTGVEIPDHIAQVTDYVKGIEKKTGRSVKINSLVYKPHADKQGKLNTKGQAGVDFYKDIARTTGGRFRIIK
ncbi:MAG: hypothetical protein V2A34_08040 [Lentisphaerota bacterium]